jgi:hypothetical protein
MKITRKNYFEQIEKVDFPTLPDELKQAHVVLLVRTEKGRNWNAVTNDAELKQVADVAFEKLGEFLASGKQEKQTPTAGKKISPYYNIEKEVQLIHRFLDMHDKIIYRNTLEIFISTLQTAIKEKKIRKTSPVAGDIMKMQDAAIRMYNTMDSATHVMLKSETIKKLKGILVKYENALDAEERPTREKPKAKRVSLEGTPASKGKLMNSTDFVKLSFQRIGFTGKWLDLMGDPAPGFTAMVFGKPKFGKSFLCIEWAGYLARNHGKVLYAAKEEGLDATLQDKLKGKEVQHPNLTVSDYIPADLSAYDFIFLDSVNKFGLSPEDLEKLKKANPGKSFIYIFQSTKEGKFRGTNEYQHDVDVVIEVPEKGKAVQFGRFNQGGQMDIFDNEQPSAAPNVGSLEGVRKNLPRRRTKSGEQAKMIIETELGIPLEELAIEILPPKEPRSNIVKLIYEDAPTVEKATKKMAEGFIKAEKAKVNIKELSLTQIDSDKISTGAAYFCVMLEGNLRELKKIASPDLMFNYDWGDE